MMDKSPLFNLGGYDYFACGWFPTEDNLPNGTMSCQPYDCLLHRVNIPFLLILS